MCSGVIESFVELRSKVLVFWWLELILLELLQVEILTARVEPWDILWRPSRKLSVRLGDGFTKIW